MENPKNNNSDYQKSMNDDLIQGAVRSTDYVNFLNITNTYEPYDGQINIKTEQTLDGNMKYTLSETSVDSNIKENNNGFWKYEEDKTLKVIEEYLVGTYKSHYTSEKSKTQTLDLIESIGDAEPFTRSNAIKYLSRFGKKNGKSKMDILKAIHYCILLYHFADLHKNNNNNYFC